MVAAWWQGDGNRSLGGCCGAATAVKVSGSDYADCGGYYGYYGCNGCNDCNDYRDYSD